VSSSRTADASTLSPHELALAAAHLCLEKKAEDVLLLDLRDVSPVCDFFVIATGDSEPQIKAIVERVEEGLRARGEKPWHIEGRAGRRWVLMDYVHIVVHVFHRETREIYLLERLWGDAPREEVTSGTGDS
jgi:ribosome-associated protein